MLPCTALAMPPLQSVTEPTVSPQSVADLDGTELKHSAAAGELLAMVEGLLAICPLMQPYLSPALDYDADGTPGDDDLYDLMCTFGRFCMPEEVVRPGDLVECGGGWLLAAGPSEGLEVDPDRGTYRLAPITGIDDHWRPRPGLVIDPASPTGQFWGPALWRWRSVLASMHSGAYQAEAFIADVTAHTGLPVERAALLRSLATELQAVAETAEIRPGTVLLDDNPDRAALMITDTGLCSAAGTRRGPDFHPIDIEGSGCRWLWVPHIG
ncbi:MAG TPA: hypothetical protein VFU36_07145 [Jatrophihabitans sp.]|nr:hypothetical protein [Jatrophihabitans sp.]